MTTPALETSRLYLRPLQAADAVQIQSVFPQWEIVRYLAARFPWPYPQNGAADFVNTVALPEMARGHGWFWSIRRKEDPQVLIGVISLSLTPDNNRGFWLDPGWQRQGYMTEACQAVTDFWFFTLGQEVLRAPKASLNRASRQLSLNSGMRLIATGTEHYLAGELASELGEITREGWIAFTAQSSPEQGGPAG